MGTTGNTKQISDYLHLHLGCQIWTGTGYVTLIAIQKETVSTVFRLIVLNGNQKHEIEWNNDCRLVLRPLSDMTEAEVDTVWGLFGWNNRITNFQERMMNILWEFNPPDEEFEPDWRPGRWKYLISALPYLLKQGFDIFGLIEAGLAIDITKLNK